MSFASQEEMVAYYINSDTQWAFQYLVNQPSGEHTARCARRVKLATTEVRDWILRAGRWTDR